MDWATVVVSIAGSVISGPIAAGVVNVFRDSSIERQKNVFSIGSTSHMATVAFDKHIGFCEAYVTEASNLIFKLIQDRLPDDPLPDTRELSRIRREWAIWLTADTEAHLDRFEHDLPRLGGEAQVYESAGAPSRSNEESINRLIEYLRDLLGTKELTALRNELMVRSSPKSARMGRAPKAPLISAAKRTNPASSQQV
jgi:hypothetical protein